MVQANEGLSTNQISKIRIPSSTNQYNIYLYTYIHTVYIYTIYTMSLTVYIYIYGMSTPHGFPPPLLKLHFRWLFPACFFFPLPYPVGEGPCWVILWSLKWMCAMERGWWVDGGLKDRTVGWRILEDPMDIESELIDSSPFWLRIFKGNIPPWEI